jgi:hypothetical protein
MRFQELRKPLGISQWRTAVVIAMLAVVFSFLAKFLLTLDETSSGIVEFTELAGLLVLFIDLTVNFSRASNKKKFLRQNWFELLLFVPFSFVFEAFRAYEIFEIMGFKAIPFIVRTQVFIVGSHTMEQLLKSEPVRLAAALMIGLVTIRDRYRTMKYRGLLSPSYL